MNGGRAVCSDSWQTDIDAVVAWVDGDDPIHQEKRAATYHAIKGGRRSIIPAGVDNTRFRNNNEVEFCIKSIRKFAPWIRKIHLVTDRQRPDFLTEAVRLQLGVSIVDHREIFKGYEYVLPTFNSLTIETALHRIPGLADKYIYLNDDFIMLAPTAPADFFWADGVVLRGTWRRLQRFGGARVRISRGLNYALKKLFGINRAMSALQQMRGAQLTGAKEKYFSASHSPYPIRRNTLNEFFENNEKAFVENIQYAFRSLNQYATTALANHVEIGRNKARLLPPVGCLMICFNRDDSKNINIKIKAIVEGGVKFLCIQSMEQADLRSKAAIYDHLSEVLC